MRQVTHPLGDVQAAATHRFDHRTGELSQVGVPHQQDPLPYAAATRRGQTKGGEKTTRREIGHPGDEETRQ